MRCRTLMVSMLLAGLIASTGFALAPMGAPASSLRQGQWGVGFDYTYASQNIDWKDLKDTYVDSEGGYDNSVNPSHKSGTVKYVKRQEAMALVSYGLVENVDVFGGMGVEQTRMSGGSTGSFVGEGYTFNSSPEAAYCAGARATLYTSGPLKLGAMGRVTWANSQEDTWNDSGSGWVERDYAKFKTVEMQLAVGPTYQLTDQISIYGGPFAYLMSGSGKGGYDYTEYSGSTVTYTENEKVSADLTESAWFGGYVGMEIALTKAVSTSIEYQHTAFANVVGANVTYRF
jgi:hypothetical protein